AVAGISPAMMAGFGIHYTGHGNIAAIRQGQREIYCPEQSTHIVRSGGLYQTASHATSASHKGVAGQPLARLLHDTLPS
ncbi:MAG: hypothetical protein OXC07_00965, partial [Kistimonas sp.]|nr:hypothetical protein [Kistimonas sp.]